MARREVTGTRREITEDESLGISSSNPLAPILRVTRRMGKGAKEFGETEIPGTEAIAPAITGTTSAVRSITESAPVQETAGAFLRGISKAETLGAVPDKTGLIRAPQTSVGRGLEVTGEVIQSLNPLSPTNKVLGKVVGGASRVGGKVLKPITSAAGKAMEPATKPIISTLKKGYLNDIVAKLNPNKTIRREAFNRKVDIGKEFVGGGYTDDFSKNIDLALDKVKAASSQFKNRYSNTISQEFDLTDAVNEAAEQALKKARPGEQKNAVKKWASDILSDAAERYKTLKLTGDQVLAEKAAAGASGYKASGEPVSAIVGQADASLERVLRERLLSSVPKVERKALEKLLREQEKGFFMANIFEEAVIGDKPISTSRKVGRLFFPSTLAAQTVGSVAEGAVKAGATGKPPSILETVGRNIVTPTIKGTKFNLPKGAAALGARSPAILDTLSGQ